MNILIKLTCLVGLVIAPILGGHGSEEGMALHQEENVWVDENGKKHIVKGEAKFLSEGESTSEKEVKVNMEKEGDLYVATVESTTLKDGKKVKETQKIKGTEEEVKAEIQKRYGASLHEAGDAKVNSGKQVEVKMEANEDGTAKATVTTTITENGESVVEDQVIEGTLEEVKAKVEALKDVDAKIEVEGKKVIKEVVEEVESN